MSDYREWRNVDKYGFTAENLRYIAEKNAGIDGVYRGLWTHNVVEAMKHRDLPVISELYGTRSGPCIVVGAGPSLRREAENLREAQRRGWEFISTDRALRELRDIGIKELLSATTECQPECGDFLSAAGKGDTVAVNLISSPETRNTLLQRGATVYHAAAMNPFCPMWNYVYSPDFWGEDIGCVRQNLIVTFSTVDIALWMGFDPIITIGNDLCYESAESCLKDTAEFPDGSNGWMRMISDGRWTIHLFDEAATGFASFPYWHPDKVFVDASMGISPWPQRTMTEILAGADEKSAPAFSDTRATPYLCNKDAELLSTGGRGWIRRLKDGEWISQEKEYERVLKDGKIPA